MTESWFSGIKKAPPVEVFALIDRYKKDPFEKKVNLTVGAYRTAEGNSFVLPVVRKVEKAIAKDSTLLHEYLPISGSHDLRKGSINLLFSYNPAYVARCGGVQCVGGTGALRIGLDFLKSRMQFDSVYVSGPTWPNHNSICQSLNYKHIHHYRYWDESNMSIDIEGMLEDLRKAAERSIVLLHACAHNPTGVDPSLEQWKRLAEVIKEKKMFVFFDCAYQGFASGSIEEDAFAVRMFAELGFEMFIAQSFSKNFGLYDERVGHLTYFVNSTEAIPKIASMMDEVVRTTYSNPPSHGALVVSRILNDPLLTQEWKETVQMMASRIKDMRKLLFDELVAIETPGTWQHVVNQKGMFSYTGLKAVHAEYLLKEYHIYLLRDGRINMCAITPSNVHYVARGICDTVRLFMGQHKGDVVGV